MVEDAPAADALPPAEPRRRPGLWWGLVLAILVVLALYYPIGMAVVHTIDDDLFFTGPEPAAGQSRAVAMASALIERETRVHRWTANDPFFLPGTMLDNMPNFQQGIVAALARFVVEMSDQIGRTRGSSGIDADLDRAAGLLKYPGDVWILDLSTSWAPTAPSEKQYQSAARALDSYNQRLAANQAVFERRADNLLTTLDRIAKDLGAASAVVDQHVTEQHRALLDFQADDIFYRTKGRLYAYFLLLRALKDDFAPLLAERDLNAAWDLMLDSLSAAADLHPVVVLNGAPDSQAVPSHLTAQGFYLLRARIQLSEIADILQK